MKLQRNRKELWRVALLLISTTAPWHSTFEPYPPKWTGTRLREISRSRKRAHKMVVKTFVHPIESGESKLILTHDCHYKRRIATLIVLKLGARLISDNSIRISPCITRWRLSCVSKGRWVHQKRITQRKRGASSHKASKTICRNLIPFESVYHDENSYIYIPCRNAPGTCVVLPRPASREVRHSRHTRTLNGSN